MERVETIKQRAAAHKLENVHDLIEAMQFVENFLPGHYRVGYIDQDGYDYEAYILLTKRIYEIDGIDVLRALSDAEGRPFSEAGSKLVQRLRGELVHEGSLPSAVDAMSISAFVSAIHGSSPTRTAGPEGVGVAQVEGLIDLANKAAMCLTKYNEPSPTSMLLGGIEYEDGTYVSVPDPAEQHAKARKQLHGACVQLGQDAKAAARQAARSCPTLARQCVAVQTAMASGCLGAMDLAAAEAISEAANELYVAWLATPTEPEDLDNVRTQPESDRTNGQQNGQGREYSGKIPADTEVLKLAKFISDNDAVGETKKSLALQYTNGDELKASRLLKQLQPSRYGYLLNNTRFAR